MLSKNNAGFTLIEAVMVIMLLGALSVLSISTMTDSINESRFNATVDKLNSIRDAMIGNLDVKQGGNRSSFGFLGDIGALPTNILGIASGQGITSLVTNPGLPAYALNTTVRFGVGWNGPYLATGGPGVDYTKDAWGGAILYDPTASPPYLKSLGADLAAGGSGYNQDIVVQLPTTLRLASVDGFLSNTDGTPFTGAADVELSYPNGSGVITSTLVGVLVADNGHFGFTNVPFGLRSLSCYKNSRGSPTATIANIILTVDQPHVLVPADQLKW